jgi:hypothetical protein
MLPSRSRNLSTHDHPATKGEGEGEGEGEAKPDDLEEQHHEDCQERHDARYPVLEHGSCAPTLPQQGTKGTGEQEEGRHAENVDAIGDQIQFTRCHGPVAKGPVRPGQLGQRTVQEDAPHLLASRAAHPGRGCSPK